MCIINLFIAITTSAFHLWPFHLHYKNHKVVLICEDYLAEKTCKYQKNLRFFSAIIQNPNEDPVDFLWREPGTMLTSVSLQKYVHLDKTDRNTLIHMLIMTTEWTCNVPLGFDRCNENCIVLKWDTFKSIYELKGSNRMWCCRRVALLFYWGRLYIMFHTKCFIMMWLWLGCCLSQDCLVKDFVLSETFWKHKGELNR